VQALGFALEAFAVSGFTMVPDEILDTHLSKLSGSQLKVLLLIIRKTKGWQKKRDQISMSQFMEGTGLTRASVNLAIQSLEELQLIKVTRIPYKASCYEWYENQTTQQPDQYENHTRTSMKTEPGVVWKSSPQYTPLQDTNGQETEEKREQLTQLWQSILIELCSRMSRQNYSTWLRDSKLLDLEGGKATIALPSEFQLQWVSTKMKALVEKCIFEVLGKRVYTEYVVSANINRRNGNGEH
jgi:phage replication O-like protein O